MTDAAMALRRLSFLQMLQITGLVLVVGSAILLCVYKIADADFWWHVKAGEIMVQTRGWIQTDPFAYTREGQPYLATHEWLAQIVLFLVWRAGGATGVILLRTTILAAILLLLLSIDRRRSWLYAPLTTISAALILPGFVDRPQLFTFLLFTVSLVLCLRFLDLPDGAHRRRLRLLLALLAVQVLWINLHGAAVLLGLVLYGALCLQRLWDLWRGGGLMSPEYRCERMLLLSIGAAMVLALFASPDGIRNLWYLRDLLSDRTISFIREWEPRRIGLYLRELGPLWILTLLTIAWSRRHVPFVLPVVIFTGILSRQAFRHEMIFVIAATGIVFHQLRGKDAWRRWTDMIVERRRAAVLLLVLLWAMAGWIGWRMFSTLTRGGNLAGYGTVEPAKDAFMFVEREGIQGPMFNTYELGGYLEYRGVPERRVFVDGRNVDFGYAFLRATFDAAQHPDVWKQLEDRYDFTHAFIHYDPLSDIRPLPYAGHLKRNAAWVLVYLDDWVAVYVKDTPEQRDIVLRTRYRLLTPEGLETASVIADTPRDQLPALEQELVRSMQESPGSLKPRLVLARLYAIAGLMRDAEDILRDATKRWTARYEPIELLAALYASQARWAEAGAMYEAALRTAGDRVAGVDYTVLAEIFEKAGDVRKAKRYRKRAERE